MRYYLIDGLLLNLQVNGRQVFKVVYVILESQYQSSLTGACKRINASQKDVAIECTGSARRAVVELSPGSQS